MIEEMEGELIEVIEDLDRAMNVEALRLVNETGKISILNLPIIDPQGFGVAQALRKRVERGPILQRGQVGREQVERARAERAERELLFRRLKPVQAGYHRKLCCMDGTRQSLLNQIMEDRKSVV